MIQNKNPPEPAEILLYQTEDGQTWLEVAFREETCWLSLNRLAELFWRDKSVVAKFATTPATTKYTNSTKAHVVQNPLFVDFVPFVVMCQWRQVHE